MKTVYIDQNSVPSPTSIWIKDTEVIWAGTVISSMSVKRNNEDYKKIALEHDVHFIFDDKIPVIDFYTVPLVDIFATDSTGGYIGSIGEAAYFGSDATICYISPKKECFFIADNFSEFIKHLDEWKQHLTPYNELEFFTSKEEAEKKYEFLNMLEFSRINRVMHMEKCFDELLEAQKLGIKYIFTNNIYRGGTGSQLLKELKEIEGFNIPIIIHTISQEPIQYFLNLGFDGCLKKPIKQEETIQILKNLL